MLGEQSMTACSNVCQAGGQCWAGVATVLCRGQACSCPEPNTHLLRPAVLAWGHLSLPRDNASFPRLPGQSLPADPRPTHMLWPWGSLEDPVHSLLSIPISTGVSAHRAEVGTSPGHLGQGLPIQAFLGPAPHLLSAWSMPRSEQGGRSLPPPDPSIKFAGAPEHLPQESFSSVGP